MRINISYKRIKKTTVTEMGIFFAQKHVGLGAWFSPLATKCAGH
jgi:hypothetical protein